MRKIGLLLTFLLLAVPCLGFFTAPLAEAQTSTIVSGTVTDVNGVPYSNSAVTATLSASGTPTIIVNGVPVQIGGIGRAVTDAAGKFTIGLFCNTSGGGCSVISPSGSHWQVAVVFPGIIPPLGTGTQTCSATLSITGATQSVTSSFSSCPAITNPSAAGGAVSSVSNVDGSLTISPTTGAVVASLDVANPNTWTGLQTGTINASEINGIPITGTPVAGDVPVASGPSAAIWNTPPPTPTLANVIDITSQAGFFGDSQEISGCSWPSGATPTITCSTGPFSPNDCVGGSGCTGSGSSKLFEGYSQCVTDNLLATNIPTILRTTVASYISATQITVTGSATALASGSQTCIYWGHSDDTAATNVDAAATASTVCPSVFLPANRMLWFDKGHFNVSVPSCQATPQGQGAITDGYGELIRGWGKNSSVIYISSALDRTNSATCNGHNAGTGSSIDCFGGQYGQYFKQFQMTGGGNLQTTFGSTTNIFDCASYCRLDDMMFVNYGSGNANALVQWQAIGSNHETNVEWNGFGYKIAINGGQIELSEVSIQDQCGNHEVELSATTIINSYGGLYGQGKCAPNGQQFFYNAGTFNSHSDLFYNDVGAATGLISVNNYTSTSILNLFASRVSPASGVNGTAIDNSVSGARTFCYACVLKGGSSGNSSFSVSGACTIDMGGVQIAGGPISGCWSGDATTGGALGATGNWVLTSGWSSSTTGTFTGFSKDGGLTITLAGTPSTGAVLTYTFPTAFLVVPSHCDWTPNQGETQVLTSVTSVCTKTTDTITFNGTLAAANTIIGHVSVGNN